MEKRKFWHSSSSQHSVPCDPALPQEVLYVSSYKKRPGTGGSTIPSVEFVPGEDYTGEGVSCGLARGMLVFTEGRNITGEGMGIGAIALKGPGLSCFSRGYTTEVLGPGIVERTFLVDCRLLWGRGQTPSILLTGLLERIAGLYMRWPGIQPFLRFTSPVRSALGLKAFFEPISPVAEARFVYRTNGDSLQVSCTISPQGEGFTSAIILNELAADSFTHGYSKGNVTPPPTGWIRFKPGCDLYDPVRRLRFCFTRHNGHRDFPGKVWWGREYTRTLRWAGFELEFDGIGGLDRPLTCAYEVRFARVPAEGGDQGA